jgi:hypothetical protein
MKNKFDKWFLKNFPYMFVGIVLLMILTFIIGKLQ